MTRPEPGASETAKRLDALGFRPVVAPAMRIMATAARLPEPARVAALLVTSGQAIPGLPAAYHGARMFTVGDATAERARQAGFRDVVSAGGDAGDLIATVRASVAPGATLLLATGRGLGHALTAALREADFAVVRRCLYTSESVRRLPPCAASALRSGRLRAALFFSADTAARFMAMIRAAALHDWVRNTDAVAISHATAVALDGLPWRRILIASRPNQDAMLALLQ